MSGEELPREADVEEVSNQLTEGLKMCRAMVANYRVMIGADAIDHREAANDPEQREAAG